MSPAALNELSANEQCDMPTLFKRLQDNGLRTVAYPMHEPWLDVGRPSDYESAQRRGVTA
jgi:NDP-sugar pyrophosphorylase family protein